MKRRILNARLAAIVASIRHGEMLFIADSGSGTGLKALYPLDPSVEYLDLEVVTGSPTFEDLVRTLAEAGDFEGVIITEDMPDQNPKDYGILVELFGKEKVREINYAPEYYNLRDRCKAVIQTGDIGIHAQAVLIAGYPSADIDTKVLLGEVKFTTTPKNARV
jgi:D-ribose pyranase